ncbi:MAG: protein-export chaperone SecB [Actinobacteria bacterium]|nr:protein-export chaperone SecB [Actinomycetota bacterium]
MNSPLRLDAYRIDRLLLEANQEFDGRDEFTGTIDVDPEHLRHTEQEDAHQLTLTVSFGPVDDDPTGAPYTGEIVGRAFFHLGSEDLEQAEKTRLVIVNGGAILYGLLRAQIAQVTALSHFGTFLLPPVNLVEAFRAKWEAAQPPHQDPE